MTDQPTLPVVDEVIARVQKLAETLETQMSGGLYLLDFERKGIANDLRTLLQRLSVPNEEMVEKVAVALLSCDRASIGFEPVPLTEISDPEHYRVRARAALSSLMMGEG